MSSNNKPASNPRRSRRRRRAVSPPAEPVRAPSPLVYGPASPVLDQDYSPTSPNYSPTSPSYFGKSPVQEQEEGQVSPGWRPVSPQSDNRRKRDRDESEDWAYDEYEAKAPRIVPSTELVCLVRQLAGTSTTVSLTEDSTGAEIVRRTAHAIGKPSDMVQVVIQGKSAWHPSRVTTPLKEWADIEALRAEGMPSVFVILRLGGPDPLTQVVDRYMNMSESAQAKWDLKRIGDLNEGVSECPICMERKPLVFFGCCHGTCSGCLWDIPVYPGDADPLCPFCRVPIDQVL